MSRGIVTRYLLCILIVIGLIGCESTTHGGDDSSQDDATDLADDTSADDDDSSAAQTTSSDVARWHLDIEATDDSFPDDDSTPGPDDSATNDDDTVLPPPEVCEDPSWTDGCSEVMAALYCDYGLPFFHADHVYTQPEAVTACRTGVDPWWYDVVDCWPGDHDAGCLSYFQCLSDRGWPAEREDLFDVDAWQLQIHADGVAFVRYFAQTFGYWYLYGDGGNPSVMVAESMCGALSDVMIPRARGVHGYVVAGNPPPPGGCSIDLWEGWGETTVFSGTQVDFHMIGNHTGPCSWDVEIEEYDTSLIPFP